MELTKTLSFASQFLQYRKQRGLSVGRLSGRSGLSKATLENWQSGRTLPSAPELEALISALELGSFDQRILRRAVGVPRAIARLPEGERPPLTGGLLRAMRLRQGLTQCEVARRLSVHQGTLAKWEKSDDWPEADKLSALCAVLGAKPQEAEAILGGIFLPWSLPPDASLEQLHEQSRVLHDRINQQPNDPLLDLAFLGLESQLWLHADQPATQRLLWQIGCYHNNFLILHQRYDEMLPSLNRILSISFDPSDQSTSYLQSAVIQKALALWRFQNGEVESVPRRKRAIAFLTANQGRIKDPECLAWYWMELVDLLVANGAYDEARNCLDRSNAIPHPECERGTMGESALVTARHLTQLGCPREALTLLDSTTLGDKDFTPMMNMRLQLTRASALAALEDTTGAMEMLSLVFDQMNKSGIEVMRPRAEALALQLTRAYPHNRPLG